MNFNDAISLAKALMAEHNVNIPLVISRGKIQMGYAKWKRDAFGVLHPAKLGLSHYLIEMNDEPLVRNTILHEIAHIKCGNAAGHNYFWQSTARAIGCTGERCVSNTANFVKGSWVGVCPNCGKEYSKYRGGKRVVNGTWRCRCGGMFKYEYKGY